jgi:signal transduction histidine kinase
VLLGRYLHNLRQTAELAVARAEDAELRRRAEAEAARLAERARLAGDLHDIVAHHMSAIALRAGAGHYAATHAADPLPEAVQALETIRDDAGQALTELRGLLRVLRDPLDADPETLIREAVDRIRAAGLQVEARVDERTAEAPPAVRIAAARTVQEALTNALKHAGPGADVLAVVRVDDACVRVDVTDSGAAGERPSLPGSGRGLDGMRERVTALGGTLAAGPTGHGGWRLAVSLPFGGAA